MQDNNAGYPLTSPNFQTAANSFGTADWFDFIENYNDIAAYDVIVNGNFRLN